MSDYEFCCLAHDHKTPISEVECSARFQLEQRDKRIEELEAALRIVPGFVTNRARADFVKDTLAATEQGESDEGLD